MSQLVFNLFGSKLEKMFYTRNSIQEKYYGIYFPSDVFKIWPNWRTEKYLHLPENKKNAHIKIKSRMKGLLLANKNTLFVFA